MAIIEGNSIIKSVSGLNKTEKDKIMCFLQGAVYCWCKNNCNQWFSLSDLMGGLNYLWEGTPLFVLWVKHKNNESKDPVIAAGKDAGWLLKETLQLDKRNYSNRKSFKSNEYLYIP